MCEFHNFHKNILGKMKRKYCTKLRSMFEFVKEILILINENIQLGKSKYSLSFSFSLSIDWPVNEVNKDEFIIKIKPNIATKTNEP